MSDRKRQITRKEKVAPVKFRPFSIDYLRQVYQQEGSIRLQNEVETLPFVDQAYIIREFHERGRLWWPNALDNFPESKLDELIVKDLLKMFYRQVRAYKFQYDSTGRLDTDLTVSLYGADLEEVLEDIYTMTNAPPRPGTLRFRSPAWAAAEIRGVIHYLKEVFLESNIYDLRYLPYYIDQYYTYLKFKYVKSGSDGFNLDRDIKLDVIPILGQLMTDIFQSLEDLDEDLEDLDEDLDEELEDLPEDPSIRIVNDVQYMLKRASEFSDAAGSCFNTLTDIVQFSRFSDQSLSNFLTSILSRYEGRDLANYIRGVLIGRVLKYGVDNISALQALYEKILLSEKRKPDLVRILIIIAERISQETPQK